MSKTLNSNYTIFDNLDRNSRFEEFLWILSQADRRCLEKLAGNRIERKAVLDNQIEGCNRKIIKSRIIRSSKNYNLTQAAHLLKVHRQTIYYWIKKGWVKLKRDYRNYPVFTVLDIENIIKWRNTLNNTSF
jgi:transcriptional regulator with PAS, ATPase and Fis domain